MGLLEKLSWKIFLDPLLWTFVYFILIGLVPELVPDTTTGQLYQLPWLDFIYRWLLVLSLTIITWIVSAYRFLKIEQFYYFKSKGAKSEVKSVQLTRGDFGKGDGILEIEIKKELGGGFFWFNKILKHLRINMIFDEDYVALQPSCDYHDISISKGSIKMAPTKAKNEHFSYKFLLVPNQNSGKTYGDIEFTIVSSSKSKYMRFICHKIAFKRTKRLLIPIPIHIIES